MVVVVAGCSWAEPNFFFSSTVLTREPELGRKLLDLHKLYNTVTKLGGYDKVTEQKGELRRSVGWSRRKNRALTVQTRQFRRLEGYREQLQAAHQQLERWLPPQDHLLQEPCVSSSLSYPEGRGADGENDRRAYEISNFFHKDPPPKEWLEDRSAAGGAIMTRTAEDFMAAAPSPKTDANGASQSPPPTEKRSKFDLVF
jgi:chromatin structure-remodeling complex subunit RSC9